ncbi:uncharacterized protein LACBIDRAFT_333795 [Laccaria bicolor S238N-H82]|uniref:Predicted protein n=1 Tax=Laccaria bicolor (strain S238N-H82 / ATCC MYA-4686) TaxID=486041 RepID=B0DX41_LACBS|nr:uncharacterized protein LACBIDRAFT_333795 [Laccaria bicolor S238N-H82]EDR00863.1 predicted protein [Laccaria bicolor S238N-H82]|eukprot:XP_001888457.1 predicted protein [Laccaria bicolor S238N-H82]
MITSCLSECFVQSVGNNRKETIAFLQQLHTIIIVIPSPYPDFTGFTEMMEQDWEGVHRAEPKFQLISTVTTVGISWQKLDSLSLTTFDRATSTFDHASVSQSNVLSALATLGDQVQASQVYKLSMGHWRQRHTGMLFLRFISLFHLVFLIDISVAPLVQAGLPTRNDGIHLAVHPRCGPLSGNTTNVNGGISPWTLETIVAFGVPTLLYVSSQTNLIRNTKQSGACTDLSLWPSNPKKVDFLGQMETFLGQSNNLDPETTLYAIFFGINDYLASLTQVILDQIKILSSPPTNARLFLVADVYGRGTSSGPGEAYKQAVISGLNELHDPPMNLKVSYVDFSAIWSGVLGSNPGYIAFGYTSTDACNAMCDDPEHYFYWIPGHPSKETMRIMADFVEESEVKARSMMKPWSVAAQPLHAQYLPTPNPLSSEGPGFYP